MQVGEKKGRGMEERILTFRSILDKVLALKGAWVSSTLRGKSNKEHSNSKKRKKWWMEDPLYPATNTSRPSSLKKKGE